MPRKSGSKNKSTLAKLKAQGGIAKVTKAASATAAAAAKKGSEKSESRNEQASERSVASAPAPLHLPAAAQPPTQEPRGELEAVPEPEAEPEAVLEAQAEQQQPAEQAVVEGVDLTEAEDKQRKIAEELRTVEKQIYDMETRYLENANPLGHATKGYEGFLSISGATARRLMVKPADRIFSRSSVSGTYHML